MLKIKYLRSYPKLENGKRKLDSHGLPIIVFVYAVTGPKKELDKYKAIQKANDVNTIEDEDGTVLYFTTNPAGATGQLGISVNDKIYVDTSALDLANALIKNHGLAGTIMAKDILANGLGTPDAVPIPEASSKLDE